MSNWRNLVDEALASGNVRNTSNGRAVNLASVPSVPSVPMDAPRLLKQWRKALSALDPCKPPPGWTMRRWQTFYDASLWWLDGFGEVAARNGWSTGDVFGVYPTREGYGGLLDRIGENRSLVMTDSKATWRSFGVVQAFNRTGGDGLKAFWEANV